MDRKKHEGFAQWRHSLCIFLRLDPIKVEGSSPDDHHQAGAHPCEGAAEEVGSLLFTLYADGDIPTKICYDQRQET